MDRQSGDFVEKYLMKKGPLLIVGVLIAAVWLASGFYIVNPGEQGVIRQFGKMTTKTTAGLNYHLPWPFQVVNIVNLKNVRRLEIGFVTFPGGRIRRIPEESLMLTGDENIVDAQLIIQYQIGDPVKYLFRLSNPKATLHSATEVALRSAIGQTNIDEVLTTGRAKVQDDTRIFLQHLMDSYESGILITSVKLQVVDPPDQVKDAFHEVVRAREDKERLVNQARGYREDIIPKARGKAQKMLREAEAYKKQRVLEASGDAARFLKLYEAYTKGKQVTRDRLRLEATERVLKDVDKIIIDPHVAKNLLPVLPLGRLEGAAVMSQRKAGVK